MYLYHIHTPSVSDFAILQQQQQELASKVASKFYLSTWMINITVYAILEPTFRSGCTTPKWLTNSWQILTKVVHMWTRFKSTMTMHRRARQVFGIRNLLSAHSFLFPFLIIFLILIHLDLPFNKFESEQWDNNSELMRGRLWSCIYGVIFIIRN